MEASAIDGSRGAGGVTNDGPSRAAPAPVGGRQWVPEQGSTPEQIGRAAALCFVDAERDEEIARRLGVARRTLARWKRRSDFAAAVAALRTYVERTT